MDDIFGDLANDDGYTDNTEVIRMIAQITAAWVAVSAEYRDGKLTAEEAMAKHNNTMAPLVMACLLADSAGIIDLESL